MGEISKGIETFLSFIREAEQLYRISEANEREANDRTQDILHSLELEEHDYRAFARLSKELKEVRQQRRVAKDLMCATFPIVTWVDSNKAVIKELEKLLGTVRKAERSTENRVYTPRKPAKEKTTT